jgi:hypothetical protein
VAAAEPIPQELLEIARHRDAAVDRADRAVDHGLSSADVYGRPIAPVVEERRTNELNPLNFCRCCGEDFAGVSGTSTDTVSASTSTR